MNEPYILIIPDIHEEYATLKRILAAHEDAELTVFLGDYFDTHNNNGKVTEATHLTAMWLSKAVMNPRYRMLRGNHDMHYCYPNVPDLRCSGYRTERSFIVATHMQRQHWLRMYLHTWINGAGKDWLCTHAGLHPSFISNEEPLKTQLLKLESRTNETLDTKHFGTAFVAAGHCSGGWHPVGGVTWLRPCDFRPIPDVNQLMGHTIHEQPKRRVGENSTNWWLDTQLQYYGIMTKDKFTIKKVADL